jgi:hypothetical protein
VFITCSKGEIPKIREADNNDRNNKDNYNNNYENNNKTIINNQLH